MDSATALRSAQNDSLVLFLRLASVSSCAKLQDPDWLHDLDRSAWQSWSEADT